MSSPGKYAPVTLLTSGDTIEGVFHCRKSATNSRELDVEIHYKVKTKGQEAPDEVEVQVYRVR